MDAAMSTTLLAKDDPVSAESAAELVVRPSARQLLDHRGSELVDFDRKTVESLLAAGNFFWLDLDNPTEDDFAILRDVFKFHPLAVEDSEQFNQRSKFDGYDDFVFIVIYGAGSDGDGRSRCIASIRSASSSQFIARPVQSCRRSAGAPESANRRWNDRRCCCTAFSMASSTVSFRP
jgi:CorA-like Mg2+ transporter protein